MQRSRLQRSLDNLALPVCVKVRVPPQDTEAVLMCVTAWLRRYVGREAFALHKAASEAGDAVAFYFHRLEDAPRLLARFPELELAHGSASHTDEPASAPRRKAG